MRLHDLRTRFNQVVQAQGNDNALDCGQRAGCDNRCSDANQQAARLPTKERQIVKRLINNRGADVIGSYRVAHNHEFAGSIPASATTRYDALRRKPVETALEICLRNCRQKRLFA